MNNATTQVASSIALCCALAVLAGCGGEKESAPQSSEPASTEETAPTTSDAAASPAPEKAAMGADDAAAPIVGDAARGKRVFARCAVCHSLEEHKTAFGPSLYKVPGSPAGQVAGYSYSPALAGADFVWTDEALDEYLSNPAKYLPGNKMAFPGVPSAQERADVIAYLKSIK